MRSIVPAVMLLVVIIVTTVIEDVHRCAGCGVFLSLTE